MTREEAKTKPLNELVGYLTQLNYDMHCTCECKIETWYKSFGNPQTDTDERKIDCQKRGIYDNCPQRIAYDRVMEACEKQIPKKPRKTLEGEIVCPTCEVLVGSSPYCRYCGQALDWGE